MQKEHRNIKLLSWFSFLISFRLYAAIAIIYFSRVSHSYMLGISIFSIIQITQATLEIPTGIYSDRLGRKMCLIIGSIASTLSVILYAVGQSYFFLVVGAGLEGVYLAFFSGNNDALLYETLAVEGKKDTYHEVLGKVNSMLELAWLIGGILGSVIANWSFSLLMWLSVIPQLLCLILSFQFIEPPIHREKYDNIFSHLKEAFLLFKTNNRLRRLSLASIIDYGIRESAFQFQPIFYNTLLPIWAVGPMISLNFLLSAISSRLSGKIINKLKAINLLIYQEVYSRFINIIALVFPTLLSPLLMALSSILYGAGEVSKNTLLQKEFTNKQRATMASINSLLKNCFYALVALLIGLAADKIGAAKTLLGVQVFLLPVLWIYLKVFLTAKKEKREIL